MEDTDSTQASFDWIEEAMIVTLVFLRAVMEKQVQLDIINRSIFAVMYIYVCMYAYTMHKFMYVYGILLPVYDSYITNVVA